MFHENAIHSTIQEWIQEYAQDPVQPMTDLVNFTLSCSGCPGTIEKHELQDSDTIPEVLERLQNQFNSVF